MGSSLVGDLLRVSVPPIEEVRFSGENRELLLSHSLSLFLFFFAHAYESTTALSVFRCLPSSMPENISSSLNNYMTSKKK